jgi:hypothetical protein
LLRGPCCKRASQPKRKGSFVTALRPEPAVLDWHGATDDDESQCKTGEKVAVRTRRPKKP